MQKYLYAHVTKFGAAESRPHQPKNMINVLTKYANFAQRGAPLAHSTPSACLDPGRPPLPV
jgi:hypothetical protein